MEGKIKNESFEHLLEAQRPLWGWGQWGIGAAPSSGQAAVAACEREKPGTFTF